jgi:hypothetical protein
MDIIPEVDGNVTFINNAEFIKLTVYNDVSNTANVTVHTFSSAYKSETIDGTVYTPLGGLLAVGAQQRDLRVTSADTSVTLSGIDGNNIYIVLATKIKGSKLEILRGFYDSDYILGNTYTRFTGIITSYNITEDREDDQDTFTVTVNASSYKTVLENRVSGRKTNERSWKYWNPSDTSMDNVYSIADQKFDFGQPVSAKATTGSAANTEGQVTAQTYEQP